MWSKVDQRMLNYFKETGINLLHTPQMLGNGRILMHRITFLFRTLVTGGCEAFEGFDRGLQSTKELR